ncbi:hypothetical protein [Streptomyces sp. NPDC050982]|uniref:hypothetical protein n=1 Tax=Streptomyces sp. NPDC050982 TaxID=3154746 RepID=UPI0033CE74CA
MSGIRREHVRVLNVDDESGHTGPRSAVGTGSVTAAGARPCRMADGTSAPRLAHRGIAHSRVTRGGVLRGDVLDGTRRDTDGPEHCTAGPEPRADGLASAPTIGTGRGAGDAGRPTEVGR